MSTKKRILIVEDEQIVARDLEMMLMRLGYQPVGPAATGLDAIRLAAEMLPDLVLMDVRLNGEMDGVAASAEISRNNGIPIVYLTAYTQAFVHESANMVYPFLCVAKPFSAAAVDAAIKSALPASPSSVH